MVITSGADHTHFLSLIQLLGSIRRSCRFWAGLQDISIWDLGLHENQTILITKCFPEVRLVKFPFERYPSWMAMSKEAGHYAWKPICIYETLKRNARKFDSLIWLDAGDVLIQPPNELKSIVDRIMVYSPISDGNVAKWTYKKVLEYFDEESNSVMLSAPNRNGAVFGFNVSDKRVIGFVEEFAHYACIREAIAPEGANRSNHRQDQALFTLLYYRFKSKYRIPSVNVLVNLAIHCDIDEPLRLGLTE
jgi:hypothetical protein